MEFIFKNSWTTKKLLESNVSTQRVNHDVHKFSAEVRDDGHKL